MNSVPAMLLFIFAAMVAPSLQNVVSASAACNKIGQFYAQGCSGLTKDLLGRPWKRAGAYRLGRSIGRNGHYSGVQAGTIVGFPGHVAVYIGHTSCACNFVDVPAPNRNARCLNSYGAQTVHEAYY